MCNFASFVLTRNQVWWLPDSESHSDIIKRYEINESGVRELNVVKVEVLPPADGIISPKRLDGWTVTFDQDQFPEWHRADKSADRAMRALPEKLKNLTWLDASYSKITDVSMLKNLTTLDANGSQITDVSMLTKLTTLYAMHSQIPPKQLQELRKRGVTAYD